MATATSEAPPAGATDAPAGGEAPSTPKDPMANLPGGVNPLDFLYKLATQRSLQPPEFKQVTEQGPAHMKTFVWHCSFNKLVAQGSGRSKKEAKIAAAKAIRDNLDYAALPAPTPGFNNPSSGIKRKHERERGGHDGFGRKKPKAQRGGPMGMGFAGGYGPQMNSNMFAPGMGPYYPGFGGFGGFGQGGFGGPFRGPGGGGMVPFGVPAGKGGPAPIDPKGEDPFGNGGEKGEDGANGEEKDGENGDGPSREEFMSPSFGGFFKDDDDVSALEGPDGLKRQMMMADYQSRMNRGIRSRLSKLDRHVIRKHKEIYPKESDLSTILSLVTRTEESLKKVAESLNTKELKKITGMVRVGDLSKGLLLASDRVVDLVLLTKRPPNTLILTEVETTLREKLNEAAAAAAAKKKALQEAAKPKEGEVEVKEEVKEPEVKVEAPEVAASESGVVVTRGFYSVRVTLASTATPDEEEQKSNQLLAKGAADRALSELRHSKWFAVTAANLPSCVECIRIVKDLCMRDPAWSVLTGWAVELLVERALYTAWMPLNPAASLMRVMEVMSSGLLLDDGPGLKDPCEKEDVNVVSGLTSQEREDITRSAQANLRRMHFRKLFKVLGMEEASEHEGEDGKEDNNGKDN